ncbi:MAG: hypothetical protein FJ314_07185 [SAR202 cluster bacterium]|nr:hypothetical protein [SAR202 cluster bacterium]
MVSHELKTPLATIRVARDLLGHMSPAESGSVYYPKTVIAWPMVSSGSSR